MSQAKVLNRSALFAAATALTGVGFLNVASPAQARPVIPLAPACASYLWPGGGVFTVKAGNGTTTNIPTSQDYVVGRAFYLADGAQVADATYGNPSGGITGGTSIDITINWDQGPGAGSAWHFVGKINDEGLAGGTLHATNRDDAWSSSQTFSCITPAAPPAPAPAPAPAELPKQGPTVTPDPGLTGVTFHITDRSGVASQCTYSSEGFQSSFGLPANGNFDLDVPAVRLFKNRTGTVTCDNGTSTNTSVFY